MDINALEQALANLNADSFGSEAERARVLRLLQKAHHRLEKPFEHTRRVTRDEPFTFALARLGIDVKLFKHMSADDGSAKSIDDIAKRCGVNADLMARILRHLAKCDYIEERDGKYAPTSWVQHLQLPAVEGCYASSFDTKMIPIAWLPEFFKKINYDNPNHAGQIPFNWAFNYDRGFFDWLNEHPETLQYFTTFIDSFQRESKKPSFAAWYPIQERLIDGANRDDDAAIFIVDMGGGKGRDMLGLDRACPDIPGRIIFQDQPKTIDQVSGPLGKVEPMVHDFFGPQVLHGARAYYMHSIIHDWQDGQSFKIFDELKPAMKKGYSKLLIHDLIIPTGGDDPYLTAVDWTMLVNFGALVRTREAWVELLESAGFKVNGIWSKTEVDLASVIEAELA